MISKTTLRNVEIAHLIGNYLGIFPIKANFKHGIYGYCKLPNHQTLWNINLVVQILLRTAASSFTIYQVVVMPKISSSEIMMAIGIIFLWSLSIIVTVCLILYRRSFVNLLNKFFVLNQYLCKF